MSAVIEEGREIMCARSYVIEKTLSIRKQEWYSPYARQHGGFKKKEKKWSRNSGE
jgi:hypothetical protein